MTHKFKFHKGQKVLANIDGCIIDGEIGDANYYENMTIGEKSRTEIYEVVTKNRNYEVYGCFIYETYDEAMAALEKEGVCG